MGTVSGTIWSGRYVMNSSRILAADEGGVVMPAGEEMMIALCKRSGRLASKACVLYAPAYWPIDVTLEESPPKAWMLACTHSKAATASAMPVGSSAPLSRDRPS